MKDNDFDLFYALIKLKSYLISLIDTPDECMEGLELTKEYLKRKYPKEYGDILLMLSKFGIDNDCEIAFDQKIHVKFKEIAESQHKNGFDLNKILDDLEINHSEFSIENYGRERIPRDKKLSAIVEILFKLVKTWTIHKELESNIDSYSELDEQEMIRPDEEKKLDILDGNTEISFGNISRLTNKYIELFTDYYFSYGGDVDLDKFAKDLDKVKREVAKKYSDLFKKHGLDAKWIDENLNNS